MRSTLQPISSLKPPRQLSMALDSLELKGMSAVERSVVVARLARLLMEAAGMQVEEAGDDGR